MTNAAPGPWMTVVIPSYNQHTYLTRTMASVFRAIETLQSDPAGRGAEIEIWVQDGGSTDGTLPFLEKLAANGKIAFSSGKDDGQADAINTAIRDHSRGRWIGWINSDDLWTPNALLRLFLAEKKFPDSIWFHGSVDIIDHHDEEIRSLISVYKRLKLRKLTWRKLLLENLIAQMGTFFKREAFVSVGGLDPRLHYNMDYDLWLKLWEKFGPPGNLEPLREPIGSFRMVRGTKSMDGFRKQFLESFDVGMGHLRKSPPSETSLPSPLRMRWTRSRICWVYAILKFFRI